MEERENKENFGGGGGGWLVGADNLSQKLL